MGNMTMCSGDDKALYYIYKTAEKTFSCCKVKWYETHNMPMPYTTRILTPKQARQIELTGIPPFSPVAKNNEIKEVLAKGYNFLRKTFIGKIK